MGHIANEEYPIYLALGSNLGNRQKNIETAYEKIEKRIGRIASISAFYHSRPMDFESANNFVNTVCEVISNLDIFTLFAITQNIEKEMGRVEKSVNGRHTDRIIDIDLILAGARVIDTPELTVPHPGLHERDFVLTPLCEIAPDIIHPVFGKTIRELNNERFR